jgi:hypothetical protein
LASASCDNGPIFLLKNEGTITYDVSFPYEENTLMLELYPKEMTFDFNKHYMRASIRSAWGVMTTDLIIDNQQRKYSQLLKSFSDKYYMTLDENSIGEWLAYQPEIRIEKTEDTLTIAGYLCKKSIARFSNDSLPAIELFYTNDIRIDESNWWNQFAGVEGFLLGYELEQYGKRMRLRAREVRFQPVAPEQFVVPADYIPLDARTMKSQIEKVVDEFMSNE